jgi:hypothetical protein
MSLVTSGGTGVAFAAVVVIGSTTFANTMVDGQHWVLCSTTAAWFRISAAGTAAVARNATDNIYLPPNFPVEIICTGGNNKVTIIRDAADGAASLALSIS